MGVLNTIAYRLHLSDVKVVSKRKAKEALGGMRKELMKVDTKKEKLEEIVSIAEGRLEEIDDMLVDTNNEMKSAKQKFVSAKDDTEKERWARRLVVANKNNNYLAESKVNMQANLEHTEDLIEDSKSVAIMITQKVKDATIYYKLNNQITIARDFLLKADKLESQSGRVVSKLNINQDILTKTIKGQSGGNSAIEEAQKIIKETKGL